VFTFWTSCLETSWQIPVLVTPECEDLSYTLYILHFFVNKSHEGKSEECRGQKQPCKLSRQILKRSKNLIFDDENLLYESSGLLLVSRLADIQWRNSMIESGSGVFLVQNVQMYFMGQRPRNLRYCDFWSGEV
jgi:hypothetical protein